MSEDTNEFNLLSSLQQDHIHLEHKNLVRKMSIIIKDTFLILKSMLLP